MKALKNKARWAVQPAATLVRAAADEAQRSRLPQMAAALSYRTIFSLIPMIVVALLAMRLFATDEDITAALNKALRFTGLSAISASDDAAMMGPFPEGVVPPSPTTASPGAIVQGGATAGGEIETTGSARVDEMVRSLVDRVRKMDFRALTVVGLAALIYAAIGMLVEVERAFNQIYRVPLGRSWVRRITQYWTLLTLGTLGVGATFLVTERFATWLAREIRWGDASTHDALALGLIGYGSTVILSSLLLLLAYTVVPNTRVRVWPALAGAVLAAVLWEASKWGFAQYLARSAGYQKLYGAIAVLPLFLLWVYVTWLIVLMGLQTSYYIQHGRKSRPTPGEAPMPAIVDPAAALAVMGALAARFERGESATPDALAQDTNLSATIVPLLLERLAEAGLVARVAGPEERFMLSRPADRIDAGAVLAAGHALAGAPGGALGEALASARRSVVQGRSIAEVLGIQAPPAEPMSRAEAEPAKRPEQMPAT
ncbi:MAG: YhjD/YihY/BrkB family envelope integrity protein [Phycisphaerales bacterium]